MSQHDALKFLLEGNASAAVKHFTNFIDVVRSMKEDVDPLVLCNRAAGSFELSLFRNVVKDCNEALALDSSCLRAYFWKAKALVAMGKKDEAKSTANSGIDASKGWGDYVLLKELREIALGEESKSSSESPAPASSSAAAPAAEKSKSRGRRVDDLPSSSMDVPLFVVEKTSDDSKETSKESSTPQTIVITTSSNNNNTNSSSSNNNSSSSSSNSSSSSSGSSSGGHSITVTIGGDGFEEKITKVAQEKLVQFGVGDPEVDRQIALGYFQTNSGKYQEAVLTFSALLKKKPLVVAAYLGRGTALALSGHLKDAVTDFSAVVSLEPQSVEGHRRRGQSLMALNELQRALQDFRMCVKVAPTDADAHLQKGICFYKLRDFTRASVEFELASRLESTSRDAWNHLGLALNQMGRSADAVLAHERAAEIDPKHPETYLNLGQAQKELGRFDLADKVFTTCVTLQPTNMTVHFIRGLTRYLAGHHLLAMRDWRTCLKLKSDVHEARQMLVVVLQARGRFRELVSECDILLKHSPEHVVWYHRRLACVMQRALDKPFASFSYDNAVEDRIKEGFSKKKSPKVACSKEFFDKFGLDESIPDVDQSPLEDKDRDHLIQLSMQFGPRFQYNCPGFVVNKRQWLSAGISIIHMAQTFRAKKRTMKWRQFFDMAVRWRQISEPNDPVWWVDLLPVAQFSEGYGSHTPIITGHCLTVRYGAQLPRALNIVRSLLLQKAELPELMRRDVEKATDVKTLYAAVRRDFWVTTPCHSVARPGKTLEGTRLTLQQAAAGGYEFSIRTPGTPPRFMIFDAELEVLWERLVAVCAPPEPVIDDVLAAVLRVAFFWYNLMPLSRGTAAIGQICIHAVLLSVGYEIDGPIPENYQPDWEAILTAKSEEFCASMTSWIKPLLKPSPWMPKAPLVDETLKNLRDAIVFLNCGQQ